MGDEMRTLDETIESITQKSGLQIIDVRNEKKDRFWVDRETYMDALHYLKEYCSDKLQWKADREAYEDERQKAIHALKKARERYVALAKDTKDELTTLRVYGAEQANRSLTWGELREMEGKPVWVEWTTRGEWRNGEWDLIHALTDDRIWFLDGNGNTTNVPEGLQGKTWNAYRKERG